VAATFGHVRFTRQKATFLFNHLISAKQNRSRQFDADRLCGFQIDGGIEFCGLLDWQVGCLLAI
jgi:hypothetical protein